MASNSPARTDRTQVYLSVTRLTAVLDAALANEDSVGRWARTFVGDQSQSAEAIARYLLNGQHSGPELEPADRWEAAAELIICARPETMLRRYAVELEVHLLNAWADSIPSYNEAAALAECVCELIRDQTRRGQAAALIAEMMAPRPPSGPTDMVVVLIQDAPVGGCDYCSLFGVDRETCDYECATP